MSSYADVASRGPKQSDAEKVPDAVPEILHSDSGVHSLDSLSTTHSNSSGNNSVPSYADQQLAAERAAAQEAEAEREADEAATWAREFEDHAEAELSKWESEHGSKYENFSNEAREGYERWKRSAAREFEELKRNAKKAGKRGDKEVRKAEKWAEKNKENPVVVGNGVGIAVLAGLLGVGAYRLHSQGRLTGKVVGLWAGVVGLFAVGDYYLTQFLFKKYPPKN